MHGGTFERKSSDSPDWPGKWVNDNANKQTYSRCKFLKGTVRGAGSCVDSDAAKTAIANLKSDYMEEQQKEKEREQTEEKEYQLLAYLTKAKDPHF